MAGTDRQAHWQNGYGTKGENQVSWSQQTPAPSLDLVGLVDAKGHGFTLIESRRHEHTTPWGATQKFQFSTFRRQPD